MTCAPPQVGKLWYLRWHREREVQLTGPTQLDLEWETCDVSVRVVDELGQPLANIVVENVRYFSSQPWPFPNSLMLGFTASYKSGEINTDNDEIEEPFLLFWTAPTASRASLGET